MDADQKIILGMFAFPMFISIFALIASCTISFQNISTHGVATDLVDENQEAKADIKSNFQMEGIP